MKSVMKHLFSQIPRAQISRSVFDRSHGWKSTFDSGYLVPFLVDEVLPGDSYKVKFNFLARLSTRLCLRWIICSSTLSIFSFHTVSCGSIGNSSTVNRIILVRLLIILYRRLRHLLKAVFRSVLSKIILDCYWRERY